ncbi:hypothetical protein EV401DRAFT_175595 [Pisolithus croceorrhizus]|nr:hypothetical protein EV401DRAFT_175595 [Pisolithus croceorrhizus]
MAPECLSSLWCFWRPPSPNDDGAGSAVFIPTEVAQPDSDSPLGNEEAIHGAAAIKSNHPHLPSSAVHADIAIPTRAQFEGSLPSNSVEVHGPAHTEDIPLTPPSSRPPYCLNPEKAKRHIDRIHRFRILIMGRANAGKTTILQRVCNTTDQPEIFNAEGQRVDATAVQGSLLRGHHNIENELVFQSNPRFVFHDSCGFEAGSEEQFDLMKKFVMDRSKATKLDKRIHAIWFCIPLTDSHRMVTAAERNFFDECDTGNVPVILLATKADTLEIEVIQKLEEEGLSVGDVIRHGELEQEILNNCMARLKNWLGNMRFPPHDYLPLTGMEQVNAKCTALLTCTTNALKEEGLQWLLISTQQCNLELCMKYAIMKTLKKFMSEQIFNIKPMLLALSLASWFPYHVCGIVGAVALFKLNVLWHSTLPWVDSMK